MRDVERVAKVIGECINDIAFASCLKENGVDNATVISRDSIKVVMLRVGTKDRVYIARKVDGKTFVYRYDLARVYVF